MNLVATKMFLTRGVGKNRERLAAYEAALRSAQIAEYNLVKISSIYPPGCRLVSRKKGKDLLSPGQVVYSVMAENATNEPHRLVAASVGLAIPKRKNHYGYLSEHCSFGQNERFAGEYAEDLAASMLATILGVEFSPDSSYDEKKEIWRISGEIVRTTNITQSAIGDKDGLWTTVVAAAIFIN